MKTAIISIITVLTTLLIFTACNKPSTNNNKPEQIQQSTRPTVVSNILVAKIGDFIFDGSGNKYKKITDSGEKNDLSISKTEIWERIEPLDKKRWYTPALGSYIWTNQPAIFNSIFRMEGEDYPVF